jgi:amino acid permease
MGLALALVPVMLFPILKKQNEALALGYVVFRGALETVTYIALVISWFLLLILSREYVAAGAPDTSYFQTLGALFLKGNDSISTILAIVFCLGALMLYYLLYRSKLIPRWISVWGFIAITLHLATGFLIIFQLMSPFSTINLVTNFPIFLQEMVMALWLIVKGFDPAAIAALTAKVDMD